MTFIEISNLINAIPKNPVPKSSMIVEFMDTQILIDCSNPKPLCLDEAKLLVEWLVRVVGGKVAWNDSSHKYEDDCDAMAALRYMGTPKQSAHPLKSKEEERDEKIIPKTTTNGKGNAGNGYRKPEPVAPKPALASPPAQVPQAAPAKREKANTAYVDPSDRFEAIIKRAKSFREIGIIELKNMRETTIYLPVQFKLKEEDQQRLRSESEITEHELVMIFEDYYLARLTQKEIAEKYSINLLVFKSVLNRAMDNIKVRPRDYKPIFLSIKKETEVLGIHMRQGIDWDGVDNTKIKRLSSHHVDSIIGQDKARMSAGLSRIVVRIRKCLACSALFESAGERTCGCTLERRRGYILEGADGVTL